MSAVIPGSEKEKQRLELDAARDMKLSIKSLDRTFASGSLYHWKAPPKEERDRVNKLIKDREAKREKQLAATKAKHYKRTSFVWTSEKARRRRRRRHT
eukprot:2646880-Prymnesium_polylepis.1